MRVALVRHRPDDTDTDRDSVPALLARPLEDLADDLAALGHEVLVVEARRPLARGGQKGGPSLEALDRMAQARTTPGPSRPGAIVCSTRRGLAAALDPASVDVALAVGRRAAETLDRVSSDLRVPWLWCPEATDLRSEPGCVGPWLPRHADGFVVGSLPEVELLARAGVDGGRCEVVPWQLSMPAHGSPALGEVTECATSVLTTAGAGGAGVADLIRAVAVLPEMKLCVAVDAATAAGGHTVERWARLAAGLRAGDRIRFVRITTGEGLRVMVRSSDLVVSVPHGRPETSLLATAMWAGTPLVASDVAGVRELVESGTTGLVLPPGQPRRLARALRVVGRDTPARSTWSWSAHRRAVERFDRHGTAVTMSRALAASVASRTDEPGWGPTSDRLDDFAAG
ncbi:glycosyltransferase [Longivirga aurantiaca]|uniref:Glycosyltransferase n=1 Tax=Longivirga aurantiaca TaxID=1837743 RepID=A0ABW1T3M5_9ACTN